VVGGGVGAVLFSCSPTRQIYVRAYSACYEACVSHPFEIFSGYGRCVSDEFCGLVSLYPFYLPTHQSRPFIYNLYS